MGKTSTAFVIFIAIEVSLVTMGVVLVLSLLLLLLFFLLLLKIFCLIVGDVSVDFPSLVLSVFFVIRKGVRVVTNLFLPLVVVVEVIKGLSSPKTW